MFNFFGQSSNQKTILLMGQTGSGKSSFGNLILGSPLFKVSDNWESCTTKTVKKASLIYPSINVIDTPGLGDSHGRDKEFSEQMINFAKDLNDRNEKIHLILIVLNFHIKRLDDNTQKMILFISNAFPKNLSHHLGIVFTHYEEYEEKRKNRSNMDTRIPLQESYVPKIMKIISESNGEKLYLDVPLFFLDSIFIDSNTKEELRRLIKFTISLPPIESINKCNSKYKTVQEEFENEISEEKEGDRTEVITKTYKIQKFIDYKGEIIKQEKTLHSEIRNYKDKELPKLDEKKFGSVLIEFIKDIRNGFRVIRKLNELKKEGENFSLTEELLFLTVGGYVSKLENE